MNPIRAIELAGHGVRLEPLEARHERDLDAAAADGALWEIWFTSVPAPGETNRYIETALAGLREGRMLPFAVRNLASGAIVGSTRFHDVAAEIDRVEIGYTWYAKSVQRSHVNTSCKLLLMTHAFEDLGCRVVGFRTDKFNVASQRAIEALGARKDGLIRHFSTRRDGSARDVVMYSIIASEWPEVKHHLTRRLARYGSPA
ncbi:MAG TPA: GNAT family protein [Gammaproteobacteria bacterium]|nr:GNAT family protein [Gammaproteobacteria bacterium]